MCNWSQVRFTALVLSGVLAIACDCGKGMVTRTRVDVYMYSSAEACDVGVIGPNDPRSRLAREVLTTIPARQEVELLSESIVKDFFCYRARYDGEVGYIDGQCCDYRGWWLP